MSRLNTHNLVARVVNPLQVGRWIEVERELDLIVRRIQLQQVLDGAQRFQRLKFVARHVNVLEVLVLLQAVDGDQLALRDGQAEEGVGLVIEGLADAVESFLDDLGIKFILVLRQLLF